MFLKFIVLIFGIHASCSTANQNVHIDKCGGLPLKQFARSSCPDSKTCYTECDSNYQFSNGQSKVELFCNAGIWSLKGLGDIVQFECDPTCASCINGQCVAPNICVCDKNFAGPRCDEDKCNTVPNILNSDQSCTPTNCQINCKPGYKFADGATSMDLKCKNGGFVSIQKSQAVSSGCQPVCNQPCQNGGVCDQPDKCSCPKDYEGNYCEHERGCKTKPAIQNAKTSNCNSDTCNAYCEAGYAFPDSSTDIELICVQRVWQSKSNQNLPLNCTPYCFSPCKNGGKCTGPNKCTCPSGYEGDHCESEKDCQTKPASQNTTLNCDTKQCDITCASGHAFPDGTTSMKMTCEQHIWKPVTPSQSFQPYCQPVCTPSCLNGGQCIGPNKCLCPSKYEGNQCEHKKGCPTKPDLQNAVASDCNLNKCTVTCDTGFALPDGTTKMDLTCIQRNWYSAAQPTQNADTLTCKPICDSPCLNGGQCTKPNTCSCPAGFDGAQCGNKICKTDPPIRNAVSSCTPIQCKITCNAGYNFKDSSVVMYMSCQNGNWVSNSQSQNFNPECQPVCNSPCLNGGQCTNPNTCSCPAGFDGPQCGNKICTTNPTAQNAVASCTVDHCKINCNAGYNFPDGATVREMNCIYSHWITVTFDQNSDCQPICNLPCLNGGQCTKPNTCSCPAGFDGAQCGNKICKTDPPIRNAVSSCTPIQCKITCNAGYNFKDSSVVMDMSCQNGNWVSNSQSQNFNPECQPVCNSPCLNGGQCTNPNTCSCPAGFDGPQCGNKICTTNPTAQNAVASCTADHCKINCNAGYNFPDSTSVMEMSCKNGNWVSNSANQNFNPDCQLECNAGLVFNNCGPRTERTCASAYEDRSVCVSGCFCPNGMVKHNGNCIQSNQCPCSRNGVEYPAGSSSTFANDFSTNAEVCQCNNGQMACTSQSFTRERCTAWGDPHFTTIYGNSYNFMGYGTYRYLETDNIEIDAYLVGWPNSWDAATVTDSVTIKAKFNNKEATIKLMKDLYVQVNGASNYRYPLRLLDGFAVINKPSSNQISVSFQNGFRVFWNGAWQVDIDVPSIYYGGMSGLCTSEYNRRRRSTNAGDKKAWLTSIAKKSCIGESCKNIEQAVNVPHPCDSNMETKKRAEGLCARLKSDTFSSCHGTVDPESYYENCLFDACASNHDIDLCMCGAFTAYANECSRRGNVIEQWRESIQECAIKCPKGQIYQECSKSCYHGCADLILYPKNCTRDCVAGCRCPQGKVLDEKDECIQIDMCPPDQNLPTFKCQPRPDPIGTNQTCTCIGTEWECVNCVDDHTPTPQGIDSRPCEPVSLNATQTVGIVQITGAVYGKCVNTGPIRGYKECRGTCEPVTSYTGLTRRKSHEEKCCSMSKYETVQVPLLCESGIKLISSVHVAKECSCQNCD